MSPCELGVSFASTPCRIQRGIVLVEESARHFPTEGSALVCHARTSHQGNHMSPRRGLESIGDDWVAPTNLFVGVLRKGWTTQGPRSNKFGRATHTECVGIGAYMRLPGISHERS